jgi:hypothetical protein
MSIQKKSLISSLQSAKKANVVKEDLGAHAATVSPATKSPVRANLSVRKLATKHQLVRKGAAKSQLVKKAAAKNQLVRKGAAKTHALSSKVR